MPLTIISWNIFFNDFDHVWRVNNICDIIDSHSPDIICLQEVIPEFWEIIKKKFGDKYETAYKHPFLNNTNCRCYGEVILSRLPIKKRDYTELRSYHGRVNTWIEVEHKGKNVTINTAHLDSYTEDKFRKMRQIQLQEIKKINSTFESWIWIGDSNMRDDEKSEMYDFGEDGETYHHDRFWAEQGDYEAKYDRVWFEKMSLLSWKKLGTEMIDGKWLSDHDGILVAFE